MGQEGTAWDVGYGELYPSLPDLILNLHYRPTAVLFLCSKEAKWVTGLIMPVDGGTTAGKSDRPALTADMLAETTVPDGA